MYINLKLVTDYEKKVQKEKEEREIRLMEKSRRWGQTKR